VARLIPVSPKSVGIALLCDSEGRILEIVGDQLGLTVRFPTGRIFSSCLALGSLVKSLSFLQEIRERHATFEWELQVDTENGQVLTLCFDGCILDGRLLILGAASSQELLGFLDDLMRIQNEQINGLRPGLKELSLKEYHVLVSRRAPARRRNRRLHCYGPALL
jgi:hypothetical protein